MDAIFVDPPLLKKIDSMPDSTRDAVQLIGRTRLIGGTSSSTCPLLSRITQSL
jgi:tetrahydromethanopterin S-methyltransferase subunit F